MNDEDEFRGLNFWLTLVAAALVIAVFFLAAAVKAMAAEQCADRDLVVKRLAERYGETWRNRGLMNAEGIVEIYSSDETGTWTILLSRPDGKSCLLAAGKLWESVDPPKQGDPL